MYPQEVSDVINFERGVRSYIHIYIIELFDYLANSLSSNSWTFLTESTNRANRKVEDTVNIRVTVLVKRENVDNILTKDCYSFREPL